MPSLIPFKLRPGTPLPRYSLETPSSSPWTRRKSLSPKQFLHEILFLLATPFCAAFWLLERGLKAVFSRLETAWQAVVARVHPTLCSSFCFIKRCINPVLSTLGNSSHTATAWIASPPEDPSSDKIRRESEAGFCSADAARLCTPQKWQYLDLNKTLPPTPLLSPTAPQLPPKPPKAYNPRNTHRASATDRSFSVYSQSSLGWEAQRPKELHSRKPSQSSDFTNYTGYSDLTNDNMYSLKPLGRVTYGNPFISLEDPSIDRQSSTSTGSTLSFPTSSSGSSLKTPFTSKASDSFPRIIATSFKRDSMSTLSGTTDGWEECETDGRVHYGSVHSGTWMPTVRQEGWEQASRGTAVVIQCLHPRSPPELDPESVQPRGRRIRKEQKYARSRRYSPRPWQVDKSLPSQS